MRTSEEHLLAEFLNKLRAEIIQNATAAGNNVTGKTLSSLEVITQGNTGKLQGAPYIMVLEDGRGPSKGGSSSGSKLQDKIYEWIENKGTFNLMEERAKKSLAFIIARKIHQEGTVLFRNGGQSGVISNVITDDRIDAFIVTFANEIIKNYGEEALAILKNLEKK